MKRKRNILLALAACGFLSVTAFATHEYARLVGRDIWGKTYGTTELPDETTEYLDANGNYSLPSFLGLTVDDDCWIVAQSPPEGTIYSCPQVFEVDLTINTTQGPPPCSGNTKLPIKLLDRHAPVITIDLHSSTTPKTTFGGFSRYIDAPVVIPVITVTDACDTNPTVDIYLNGDPFVSGTPILAEGMYRLKVGAVDFSNNYSSDGAKFEIRPREGITAFAVVEDLVCTVDGAGLGFIDATILTAPNPADFDFKDTLYSSIHVRLKNAEGEVFGRFAATDIERDDCRNRFRFFGPFQVDPGEPIPTDLMLVGVSMAGTALEFDWGAQTPNVEDPDPENTLRTLAGIVIAPCGDPEIPDDPPPPPCETVQFWFGGVTDHCEVDVLLPDVFGSGCSEYQTINLYAFPQSIRGDGWVQTVASLLTGGWCSSIGQCSAQSIDSLFVEMIGNCCNCTITIDASVTLFAEARAEGVVGQEWDAIAVSSGQMYFVDPCGGGGVAVLAETTGDETTGNTIVTYSQNGGSMCPVYICGSTLTVLTALTFYGDAASNRLLLSQPLAKAYAKGKIRTTSYSVTVDATSEACP